MEDPLPVAGRDADAAVADLDFRLAAAALDADFDRRPRRGEAECVVDQDPEDLLDPLLVSAHRHTGGLAGGAKPPAGSVQAGRFEDVGDRYREVDLLAHDALPGAVEPARDKHVLDPIRHPAGSALDDGEQLGHLLGGKLGMGQEEEGRRSPDGGQRAPQLVPEHRHQVLGVAAGSRFGSVVPGCHRLITGW